MSKENKGAPAGTRVEDAKQTSLGIEKTCQNCLKRHKSTYRRQVYGKEYVGPCGDSFCFASCEMSTCNPMSLTVCDDCNKRLSR